MLAITGIGPRVGTSFLMNAARQAGINVPASAFIEWAHVPSQNPTGYWEIDPFNMREGLDDYRWEGQLVKLWASVLTTIPHNRINKLVVLERRNKRQQRISINKTMRLEEKLLGVDTGLKADGVLEEHITYMYEWLNSKPTCDLIHVYTEDLSKDLQSILNFLGGA